MRSASRSMVAFRRSAMTSMTARCSSLVEISAALSVRRSLISFWWFHRDLSSALGGVVSASIVRFLPTRRVSISSAPSTWSLNLRAT